MDRLDLPDEVHHVGSSFLNNNSRGDISQEDVSMISRFEHFLMVLVGISTCMNRISDSLPLFR
jgi:hypothetical protein